MAFYSDSISLLIKENRIANEEYLAAGIERGLRKTNGEGILVGLTSICDNYGKVSGKDCDGKIYYRGIELDDIVASVGDKPKYTFEEITYLLLFGKLPNKERLKEFNSEREILHEKKLPHLEKIMNQESGKNIMNIMARSILNLYDCDINPEDSSIENMVRQVLTLSVLMPVISINAYRKKCHPLNDEFKLISNSKLSLAENILYMLRSGGEYTELEAAILEQCLILHAELGGGNNSAFTTQVVASSGTDTYSIISSAICSIKGPKHGGANIKAFQMLQDLKNKLEDWEDEKAVEKYLYGIVHKEEFDGTGLIYGVGHAVFTLSDPRTKVLKEMARTLSKCKGREKEFFLYESVERIAPEVIRTEKKLQKPICANVDFYSGFIYDMLGIPTELFTPMFVNARIVGWGAHRIEEMCNGPRIIHPAFQCVSKK